MYKSCEERERCITELTGSVLRPHLLMTYFRQLMRLWYLSHRQPAKSQASLRIRAVSPEISLFAHMKYESRRRVRPNIRHLTHWTAAHARLKNEFKEDKKYHNLLTRIILYWVVRDNLLATGTMQPECWLQSAVSLQQDKHFKCRSSFLLPTMGWCKFRHTWR